MADHETPHLRNSKYDFLPLSALQGEADALLGAIKNEQIWQKGSTDFDSIWMHGQNIESLREELAYVQDRIQALIASQSQLSGDLVVDSISPSRRQAAEQCLIDNGISQDEAETVLQALGYILLNQELYPPDRQPISRSDTANDVVTSLIQAMVAYGFESCWTDGDLFDAFTVIGITKEDLKNAGMYHFAESNFDNDKGTELSIDLNNTTVIQVGEKYIFTFLFNDGDCEELYHYNGCIGTVTQKWEKAQYIGTEPWEKVNSHGGLFEVVFEDGSEFDVYGEELQPVQMIDKKKSPLETQIQSAEARVAARQPSQKNAEKGPDR